MHKSDFPVFANNPGLIYLDSAATGQKPSMVIDGIKQYLENDYANIHRGRYDLSERSEELFWTARKKVASWINAQEEEVIFTASSTDSVNLLAQSLVLSGWLKKDDVIVLCEADHHANIVPRQMAAEQAGCMIKWVGVTDTGHIDKKQLELIIEDGGMRLFAAHIVSNVIGIANNIKELSSLCDDETIIVVDASQAVAHQVVDVQEIGCDFLFFTGHKIGAQTGIGVLYGKKKHLKTLQPSRGGGGSIESVITGGYTLLGSPDKFEPGTPNLVGVASLLYALNYMESVGGGKEDFYTLLHHHEEKLIAYAHKEFALLEEHGVILLGGNEGRTGLFSFLLPEEKSAQALGQYMATKNIAIRCGGQCAHPYHESLKREGGSCRISFWLYTELEELERFFEALKERL